MNMLFKEHSKHYKNSGENSHAFDLLVRARSMGAMESITAVLAQAYPCPWYKRSISSRHPQTTWKQQNEHCSPMLTCFYLKTGGSAGGPEGTFLTKVRASVRTVSICCLLHKRNG